MHLCVIAEASILALASNVVAPFLGDVLREVVAIELHVVHAQLANLVVHLGVAVDLVCYRGAHLELVVFNDAIMCERECDRHGRTHAAKQTVAVLGHW